MNKQPQFSIITICYNSSATIERTIKSVLAQTFTDYEYIIVDGGSKDSTLDIIKKYEPLFEGRMKWKSEPDKGIYDAMNKGIERSSGTIIGIVNSDDWLEADALENVNNFSKMIQKPNKVIICGSLRFHYKDGKSQIMNTDKNRFYQGIAKHSFGHGAYHPSMFVGRDVYEDVGLFDTNFYIAADIDFVYRCYKENIQFHFMCQILNNMSDGGISNHINWKYFISDKKYYVKKYRYSRVGGWLYIAKICTLAFIRQYVPSGLFKAYRKHKLK